jgi:hypothetical protein
VWRARTEPGEEKAVTRSGEGKDDPIVVDVSIAEVVPMRLAGLMEGEHPWIEA